MRTHEEKILTYNTFIHFGLIANGHSNLVQEPFNKLLAISGDVLPNQASIDHTNEYPYVKIRLNPIDYYDIIEIWSELNEVREYFRSQD